MCFIRISIALSTIDIITMKYNNVTSNISIKIDLQSTPLNRDKSPGTEWFPYIEANTKFHWLIGNSA